MNLTQAGAQQTQEQIIDAIRGAERFVLITHEHPDGDALEIGRAHV